MLGLPLKSSIDPPEEWLEACQWLGSHTQDPGMDFNGIYEALVPKF